MTKTQKDRLDAKWKSKVLERDDHRCTMPGCNNQGTDAHHIIKCRYLNTRWDIDNGRCLCRKCHSWVETHPAEYEAMIIRGIGAWEYALLREKAQIIKKHFYDDWLRILA
jgi:hypothetical protein